jgi:hypothetical protein
MAGKYSCEIMRRSTEWPSNREGAEYVQGTRHYSARLYASYLVRYSYNIYIVMPVNNICACFLFENIIYT